MRISDWSSVVCSSDLGRVPGMKNPALPLVAFLALVVAPAADAQDGSAYYGIAFGDFDYDAGDGAITDKVSSWRPMINYPIGRASCRERVCQYVSISVVAVSLKKKK